MRNLRSVVVGFALLAVIPSLVSAEWVTTNSPAGFQARAFVVGRSALYAGTSGGVFVANGAHTSWTAFNAGLVNTDVTSLAASVNATGGAILLAGTPAGVFFSFGTPRWWGPARGLSLPVRALIDVVPPDEYEMPFVLAATDGGGILRSNNNGLAWWAVNTGLTNRSVRTLAASTRFGTVQVLAGTGGGGVFASSDGVSWRASNSGLAHPHVSALSASPAGAVFAGTLGGGVYRTTDDGRNWVAVNEGLTNPDVHSLSAVGDDGAVAAGTGGGGVFVSVDGGDTWAPANTGLPAGAARVVLALVANGTQLFAGTGAGVFRRPLSELIQP